MSNPANPVAAFTAHNHKLCCGSVMATADELASSAGLSLTPVRRRTLEILLEEHRAMGAYDVLERLAADGFGAQPPVAYRALDFLVSNGLAPPHPPSECLYRLHVTRQSPCADIFHLQPL